MPIGSLPFAARESISTFLFRAIFKLRAVWFKVVRSAAEFISAFWLSVAGVRNTRFDICAVVLGGKALALVAVLRLFGSVNCWAVLSHKGSGSCGKSLVQRKIGASPAANSR